MKSNILFLLKEIPGLHPQTGDIQDELLKEAVKAKKDRKFDVLPDLLFGCQNHSFFSPIELQALLTETADNWTREKLSKFILFLLSDPSPSQELPEFVRMLEVKIEQEFNSWIEPDIWFSIIESEKLINSNIG